MLENLSLAQRAVLFILMGEAREVPNTYFTKDRGYKLDNKIRDNLERLGLITVTRKKVGLKSTRIYLELSDLGWKECRAELASPGHRGEGAVGVALYTLLDLLQRHMTKSGTGFTAFFAPAGQPDAQPTEQSAEESAVQSAAEAAEHPVGEPGEKAAAPSTAGVRDVELLIRETYKSLARPGTWIKLAVLRARLGPVDRAEVDRALVTLGRSRDVDIVPESNQKALSAEDLAAAVVIGNQQKHLISISS